jgi:hypothetical protein
LCWDSRIVEHVKKLPAVEMRSKAWYENLNGERNNDPDEVHPSSALSAPHAGSQQAGSLMTEDDENGPEMTKITSESVVNLLSNGCMLAPLLYHMC